jgi:Chitobiase/beta-hexosaminidase C-terminal domain/Major tropism determinant N-terminal domain
MPLDVAIQLRRGTAAQWLSANPILADGEPAYETDTHYMKIGDGETDYVSLNYFITAGGDTVATPATSPESDYFSPSQEVTITCGTSGATIYYTTDDSTPTTTSNAYTTPFSVTATSTIKAIAVKAGMIKSLTSEAKTYTLVSETVASPVFGRLSVPYESSLSVTITCGTSGATIYYTTDGTTPTASSTQYAEAFSVTTNVTIKAIAIKAGMFDSTVTSQQYVNVEIDPALAASTGVNSTSASATSIVAPTVTHHKDYLIAVLVAAYQNGGAITAGVTDTQGNVYTSAGNSYAVSINNGVAGQWFYTWAKETSSNTVTATFSPSGTYRSIRVIELTGIPNMGVSPVDAYLGFSGDSTTFSTVADKTITLAGWHIENADAKTACTGFTLTTGAGTTGSPMRAIEYMISQNKITNYAVTISPTTAVYGGWIVAFKGCQETIQIVSEGQTFQPIIAVSGSPTILWTYDDGTTDSVAAPSVKDFGSAAQHVTSLRITPWSALEEINFGYAHEDGGSTTYLDTLTGQRVSAVRNLDLVAPYLKRFAACRGGGILNTISTLNFDNFTELTDIECYYLTTLTSISLHNIPKLTRLCIERCSLSTFDLSELPLLADLRGAVQQVGSVDVTWGNTGDHIWHVCLREDNLTTKVQPWAQFPLIEEVYMINTGLSQAQVDEILSIIDGFNTSPSYPFIHVEDNEIPSATGLAHIANLQSRGWTIYYDV